MTINDDDADNADDADGDNYNDDSYSGDQHANNAPKVGVLLDSVIPSTGHIYCKYALRHIGSGCSSSMITA